MKGKERKEESKVKGEKNNINEVRKKGRVK